MSLVLGYLRHYQRWDGSPGLSFDKQRALVREVARERGYGAKDGWRYGTEELTGETKGWPTLRRAMRIAQDEVQNGLLVVIPTLDGIQFNLSFLEMLAQPLRLDLYELPIYVRSGWRRPKKLALNTNFEQRAPSLGWLLTLPDQLDEFVALVDQIRERNRDLGQVIRSGLKSATERGVLLGGRRRSSYQFTEADRSRGGRTTGWQRRAAANSKYGDWAKKILQWRAAGYSIGKIVKLLKHQRAQSIHGNNLGPMQVYRILKRETC